MCVCAPEEGDSGRRRSRSRNREEEGGLPERGRSVLEGDFWPELSPAYGDLQVLHPCPLLPSRVMQAAEEGPVPARAAYTVFLHAPEGETKPASPWRCPPGH